MTNMTPGKLLSAARDAQSLTQDDIAKRLHLSIQIIRDIEADEYSQLGMWTFMRGYLCNYARLVNISETQILQALETSGLIPAVTAASSSIIGGAPVMNVTHQRSSVRYSRWIIIGITAFVLIVFILWWQNKKEVTEKNIVPKKGTTPSLVFSQPTVVSPVSLPTPPVVISQPAIMPATTVKQNKTKIEKQTSNGFVMRPTVAPLHTTYKITPAS